MNVTINITVNLGVEHARELLKLADHHIVRTGIVHGIAREAAERITRLRWRR